MFAFLEDLIDCFFSLRLYSRVLKETDENITASLLLITVKF